MTHKVGIISVRNPEPRDLDALWRFKNDPEVANQLVGFSGGYSQQDLVDWMEYHRKVPNEYLRVIANEDDQCIGHVGLYEVDHRVRSADFGILIGDRNYWGKGHGYNLTRWSLDYGFRMLNLNRIQLDVLANHSQAIRLYEKCGFQIEGRRRQAQFKEGEYVDIVFMGVLRSEWERGEELGEMPP